MHYSLHLAIRYEFDRPSGAGRQLLRVAPADIPLVQDVLSSSLTITPPPVERRDLTDFYGTRVPEITMPAGLTEIAIDLRAEVLRHPAGNSFDISPHRAGLPAELAAHLRLGPASPHHFLAPSPRIPAVAGITAFARDCTSRAITVRDTIRMLGQALHDTLGFDATATEVDTPVAEAFAGRKGVCQDFAQIMIAGLRALGIPACYAAGFLRTLPPAGQPRLQGADAMHAWVRAWAGGETGWLDYDPTNACFVDSDHITVGFGRDYGDVAPVTGMLRLDGKQKGSHSVDIEAH